MGSRALTNAEIAAKLELFSALLELDDASPFAARAYRRAAELVRSLPAPVAELVNAVDLDEVLAVAVEHGVALEVNGLADRLDLSAAHVREALEAGAELVLNSDAHSTRGLGSVELAVFTARRGGATAGAVVNTRPAEALARS